MAITRDESEEEVHVGQQGEQEGIGQGGDQEEFETRFPSLNSGRFKSQLGFGKAQRHLDLPTSGIGKDDQPGLFGRVDRFSRDEVPRLASVSWTRNDQKELTLIIGQMNGSSNDSRFLMTASAGIPDHTVFPGALTAYHFPSFVFSSIGSDEMVFAVPAQDETQTMIQCQGRPRCPCKAAIPDRQDPSTPQFGHFFQDFGFFQPFLAGFFAAGGPPAQVSQDRSFLASQSPEFAAN